MITFTFALYADDDLVSPFEMGDIEIIDTKTKISSKDKDPNQSMMIFLSVCDLLDKTKVILSNKSCKIKYFSGVDSSFSLQIKRVKGAIFIQNIDGMISCSEQELGTSIYNSSVDFYRKYATHLEENCNYLDLKKSIYDFSKFLNKT